MLILKQSTAIDIRMGPFVDATDGVTPETGISIGSADQAEVLKANGAATAAMAGTFAAVTGADGWYDYTASTSDTNTVGEVVFVMQDSSVCLPVFVRGYVVEEAVYDAMYGASAGGPLQPTTAGRTLDVTATGAAGVDWGNVENQSTAVDLSGTDIQLADTVTTNTDMRGTDSAALASVATEARLSELDAATAGKAANQIDVIAVDVAGLDGAAMRGTDGANTTTPPTVAEIRTDIDDNSTKLATLVSQRTTAMVESYAANGVAPTPDQALMAIHQMLMDFSISSTAITVEKLDGTTAFTVTLDDDTSPTSANRA